MTLAATDLPVRRNTILLAVAMAVYSSRAPARGRGLVDHVRARDRRDGLLGLGPAIFLISSALSAVPAGRLMDRIGRKPVIAGGYVAASVGCSLTALATNLDSRRW